jgi:hypothetical protein
MLAGAAPAVPRLSVCAWREGTSSAARAEPLHLHLEMLAAEPAGVLELQTRVGQALDLAAIGADEVGMLAGVHAIIANLESPDMVAQIDAPQEPDAREIGEIPVDRGAVEAERLEGGAELGMTHRARRCQQVVEDSDARRGASQSRGAQALADVSGFYRLRCASIRGHHTARVYRERRAHAGLIDAS